MTDYLPALISLVGGVLAFFFAKSGERNQVNGIGWAMAALLVAGGLLGLYVIHDKQTAAAEARASAALEADRAAVAAAKQSALVMTLVGDFDQRQIVPAVTLSFEFPYDEDSNPAIPTGFIGPFPALPDTGVAEFELNLGDVASSTYEVRRDGASRLILSRMGSELAYAFTNSGVEAIGASSPGDGAASEESEGEAGGWIAGPEPAPYGFTYHLISPAGVQLRRLLYAVTANDVLGALRFPKGMFDQAALERIEAGFASNPPVLAVFIAETEDGEPCNSYLHIPMRLIRPTVPSADLDVSYDHFELKLTPRGFVPDPCNNSPF